MTDTLTSTMTSGAASDALDSQPALPGLPLSEVAAPPDFDTPYKPSPEIRAIADRLLQDHGAKFSHLNALSIDYLWRRKGGKSRGKPAISGISRPAGMLGYYSKADFVVWVAANHVRELGLTPTQVEARVFRELLRAGVDPDKQEPCIWPFDFEGFTAELAVYGAYSADLYRMCDVAGSVPMDHEQPGEWESVDE